MKNTEGKVSIDSILLSIPEILPQLRRGTNTYTLLENVSHAAVQSSGFANEEWEMLRDFGSIKLPFLNMGAITTLDLFGLDELVLFSWYAANKSRYRRVADLGANVGLHSILMSKIGWSVEAYEADPVTAKVLRTNLDLNEALSVRVHNLAISDSAGESEFTRVLGNLTGSHLSGDKYKPYGNLERFVVPTVGIASIMESNDFIKMDVEGSEARILEATTYENWKDTDVMLEIGSSENAERIFQHLNRLGVRMFSQKNKWEMVGVVGELPSHHTEGLVFCSTAALPF